MTQPSDKALKLAEKLHQSILSTDSAKYPLNYTCADTAALIDAAIAEAVQDERAAAKYLLEGLSFCHRASPNLVLKRVVNAARVDYYGKLNGWKVK